MPKRKYEWSIFDLVAAGAIDGLLTAGGYTNVLVAKIMGQSVSYNRVRDLRMGEKGPARLSEFIQICFICGVDPDTILGRIVRMAQKGWPETMRDDIDSIEKLTIRSASEEFARTRVIDSSQYEAADARGPASDDLFSLDEYRAMHVSELGLAAKHGDTDAERDEYEAEP